MPDTSTPLELGFAEFVSKLIAEVFDALGTTQVEQQQRHADLVAASALDARVFADRFVTRDEVDMDLARMFPSPGSKPAHKIVAGAAYRPASKTRQESPSIVAGTGVEVLPAELERTRAGLVLKPSAVKRIKAAVSLRLAEERLAPLRQIVRQGIPRVLVEAGSITAKLTFQVMRPEDAAKPDARKRLALPLKRLGAVAGMRQPLTDLRLVVRQADDRAPQTSQVQASVLGEVEIRFKTVT